ncbi:MAG: ABC transporter permease [Planctomycetota bacterium]
MLRGLASPLLIVVRVLSQTIWLALAQVLANKFRTFLTTLGIIIAVASITIVVAGLQGMKSFVLAEFETVGVKRIFVDGTRPPSMRGKISWRDVQLTRGEVDAIRDHVDTLEYFVPMYLGGYAVQFEEQSIDGVSVTGIEPEWHDVENRGIIAGRRFAPIDLRESRNVCVVNESAITELNLPQDPTGTFVLLSGRRFLIVGVVETLDRSTMFGGGDSRTEIYIPFTTAAALNPDGWISYAQGQLVDANSVDEAIAQISSILRQMRGLAPDEENTFDVEVVQQFLDQFNNIARVITLIAGGIVAISLLVGGIGIMNIMLVSVSERTREIGLRKAMGAHPMIILTQFLIEAVVLCLAGAMVGLSIGQMAVLGVNAIPDFPIESLSVPVWAVLLSVGFSTGIGVLFGIFPAIKAARLDPIQALHHE